MKKIISPIAALALASALIPASHAGVSVGFSFGLPLPSVHVYAPQRVYAPAPVVYAPVVAPAPVVQVAPTYYAAPAPVYAAPTVVYTQPVYPAPVVVRPYSPVCVATPVIGFRFGYGGYHHYRRW